MRDYQLDLLVDPDRNWRWKDRDEFDLAVELGRMSPAQAEAVRAEGQRAVEEIERNAGPYSDGWALWHPGAEFIRPKLTPEWGDLSNGR